VAWKKKKKKKKKNSLAQLPFTLLGFFKMVFFKLTQRNGIMASRQEIDP
jgi:hypothetical protein